MKTLLKIEEKYSSLKHNDNNYSVGGGLDGSKFASNRHEDANNDPGKLTLGKAVQMFKKATGMEITFIKEVLEYAVPNMEWHHAGKLPKAYGGGMKKTYFLNATEIVDVAKNWQSYVDKLELSKAAAKQAMEDKSTLEARKLVFLQKYAKKLERVENKPIFFYQTAQEMNGKYGWFDSTYKSYNMTEYYSGWEFESEERFHEFIAIK